MTQTALRRRALGACLALFASGAASALAFPACSSSSPGGTPPPADGGTGPTDGSSALTDALTSPHYDATANGKGSTGAACTGAADCQGINARCQTTATSGPPFPDGYCTSACTVSKNDPNSGLNIDCPGVGICMGTGGACFKACTEKTGPYPCRDQYSCFGFSAGDVCLPSAESQCDPTKTASCPKTDAGTGQSCVQIGPDAVGQCLDACDIFGQNCAADANGARGCYSNIVGEGFCAQPNAGGSDGKACTYINDCNAGFGCHVEGNTAVCRPYCGGPGNKACTNGKQCVDFSTTVPKTTVGLCGG